jgi:hypothetical protein
VVPGVLADAEDRHDVGVVQPAGGLGLAAEAVQPRLRRPQQHLQGDAPAERQLLGLVDDAHAAAADLAHQPVVAEHRRDSWLAGRRRAFEVFQEEGGGEDLADGVGPLRVAEGVLGDGRPFAAADAGDELVGQQLDRVAVRLGVVHWAAPSHGSRT